MKSFQHAAAEDNVAVVEHRGLPRRDGALRLVEDEVHVPVLEHCDCRRLLTLVVAHARGRAQLARWDVVGDPVGVISRQLTRKSASLPLSTTRFSAASMRLT